MNSYFVNLSQSICVSKIFAFFIYFRLNICLRIKSANCSHLKMNQPSLCWSIANSRMCVSRKMTKKTEHSHAMYKLCLSMASFYSFLSVRSVSQSAFVRNSPFKDCFESIEMMQSTKNVQKTIILGSKVNNSSFSISVTLDSDRPKICWHFSHTHSMCEESWLSSLRLKRDTENGATRLSFREKSIWIEFMLAQQCWALKIIQAIKRPAIACLVRDSLTMLFIKPILHSSTSHTCLEHWIHFVHLRDFSLYSIEKIAQSERTPRQTNRLCWKRLIKKRHNPTAILLEPKIIYWLMKCVHYMQSSFVSINWILFQSNLISL